MIWEAYIMRMCQNEPNPESQIKDFRGVVFPRVGKCSQWHFLFFPILGKPFFANFLFSQCWESQFSMISCFPNVGKANFCRFFVFPPWGKGDFRWFLIFPREGKSIFADFWFSPVRESWFLPISVHRTPTKASFSRFLSIVPRIWVIFCENRWFTPVSE